VSVEVGWIQEWNFTHVTQWASAEAEGEEWVAQGTPVHVVTNPLVYLCGHQEVLKRELRKASAPAKFIP